MFGDAERPSRARAQQDAALRAYIRHQIYPYSAFNRVRLTAAGIGAGGIRSRRDLDKVAPVAWSEIGDGDDAILRPQPLTITRLGNPTLAFSVLFARLLRRGGELNRTVIDPAYKPIHWIIQQGVPVGMSANDLERLSEIGRRWLESARVRSTDIIASLIPASGGLDYWQLVAGARRAGVGVAYLDTAPQVSDVVRVRPSVVVGRAEDIIALARRAGGEASRALEAVHTVLVTGDLLSDEDRATIQRLLGYDVTVIGAWAPDGVRALWAECHGADGYHVWPAAEVVDIVDADSGEPLREGETGEVVWTALGWAGTVVVRLRTGVRASLNEAQCDACGRTTPRLVPEKSIANFSAVLEGHPGVAAWQGELSRRNGDDELVVFLTPSRPGHPGRLIRDLDARMQSTKAPIQFVVLTSEALEKRLAAHDNNLVVDTRPVLP